MSWEWSHTQEAYGNAYANVLELPKRELLVILREWAHKDREDSGRIRRRPGSKKPAGFRLPNGLGRLAGDLLAEEVWRRAEEHRTCTTGGHEAYVCPYGCHRVSFDRAEGSGGE